MGNIINIENFYLISYLKDNYNIINKEFKSDIKLLDVLKFKQLDDYFINLKKIPILYNIDSHKTGIISYKNILDFVSFCIDNCKKIKSYEFKENIESQCIIAMSNDFNNLNKIEDWFIIILEQIYGFTYFNIYYKNEKYCNIDHIIFIYNLLEIKLLNGLNFQEFFNLLQYSGEELFAY